MIPAQQADTKNVISARGLKLSLRQVAAVFDVTVVTVQTWRAGTVKKRGTLNTCTDVNETRFPRFLALTVLRYAARYNIPVVRQPQDVVNGWEHVKPGPKPKTSTTVLSAQERRLGIKKTSKAVKKKPKH